MFSIQKIDIWGNKDCLRFVSQVMKVSSGRFDVIVMGADMAGLTGGRVLAKTGYSVHSLQVRKIPLREIPVSINEKLQHFSKAEVKLVFSAFPVAFRQWTNRRQDGLVGIPQRITRSLFAGSRTYPQLKVLSLY